MKNLLITVAVLLLTLPASLLAEVTPGTDAPTFELTNSQGEPVKLEDYKGKNIVLEWINPDCPYVKRHYREGTMKELASKYSKDEVVWLAVNSTNYMDKDDNRRFVESHDLPFEVLDDSPGKVGKSYGAKTTPHMFVINKQGDVVYQGAIDDDPHGEKETRVNYVDEALKSVLSGSKPKLAETKSYGCSVKYKS